MKKKAKRLNFKEFSLEQVIFHVLGVNKPFNELEISEDELLLEKYRYCSLMMNLVHSMMFVNSFHYRGE